MSTLFQWNSRNAPARRCDSRCHNSKKPKCTCICGGKYHGCATKPGGLETARQDMNANIALWRTQEERAAADQKRHEIKLQVLQLTLFDER